MSDKKEPEVLKNDPIAEAISNLFRLNPPPPDLPFDTGFIKGWFQTKKLERELYWEQMKAEIDQLQSNSTNSKTNTVTQVATLQLTLQAAVQNIQMDLLESQERIRKLQLVNSREQLQLEDMQDKRRKSLDATKPENR